MRDVNDLRTERPGRPAVQPSDGERVAVFVYGTLKRGHCRAAMLAGQKFAGTARTHPWYRLHDLGSYPALVPAKDGREIEGEVWHIDPSYMARLDQVEGVDRGLYRRGPIDLQPPFDTQHVTAWFYLHDVNAFRNCGVSWSAPATRM